VATAFGAWQSPVQFYRSYLVAWLFWLGLALGSLAILMINHITGGAWGAAIRRLLESAARTMPLLALLFLPIALGVRELYEWARPDVVAHDPILQHKSLYLNVPFFLGRAALYFVAWSAVAFFLARWSLVQDSARDDRPAIWLEQLSRGGLLLLGMTGSFASVDWMMSLEPHWFSTIYGFLFMGGCVLGALAFAIAMASAIADRPPLSEVITPSTLQDLGKLLFAFVMLWAYFSLSQFLIIWSADLPEEIPWYLRRLSGGWRLIILGVIGAQFLLPFVLLLSRRLKPQRAGAGRGRDARAARSLRRPRTGSWCRPSTSPRRASTRSTSPRCSAWAASGSRCSCATSRAARSCRSTTRASRRPRDHRERPRALGRRGAPRADRRARPRRDPAARRRDAARPAALVRPRLAAREAPPAPLAEVRTPPEPRLLQDPRAALLELRAEEDAILHSYGWVNRDAGIVHIPIERAIDVLAKKAPAR
jgi:hypothetical protein